MTTHNKLRRNLRQRLRQIARSVIGSPGDPTNAIRETRVQAYFQDSRITVAAVSKKYPEMSIADATSFAETIDPFEPSAEMVEWHWQSKGGDKGFRPICKFGPEQTIRHRMIAAAVDAQLPRPELFFDRRRTGAPAAVKAIINAMQQIGPFVLSVDIKDCFQSIDIDAVYALGILPPEVVRYALDYRHLPLQRKDTRHHGNNNIEETTHYQHSNMEPIAPGPRGLLQGSPTSNAILRHLLADLEAVCGIGVRVIVYVDNIFVICRSADECGRVRDKLARHLAGCRAGSLLLGAFETHCVEDGFEQLGYFIFDTGHEEIGTHPADKHLDKLTRRLENHMNSSHHLTPEQMVRDVIAPFPAVDDFFRKFMLEEIELRYEAAVARAEQTGVFDLRVPSSLTL